LQGSFGSGGLKVFGSYIRFVDQMVNDLFISAWRTYTLVARNSSPEIFLEGREK